MKKSTKTKSTCLAIASMAVSASLSQAAVLISSIGTTSSTSTPINDGVRAGKAVNFVMASGSNYTFDLAKLSLADATTTELNALNLGIWSNEAGTTPIASKLVSLSYSGISVGNVHTFTPASAFTLVAESTYWLVIERFTSASHEVAWESFTEAATGTIATNTARIFGSSSPTSQTGDPATWEASSSILNAMEIQGTAVPEPSYAALLGLGALALVLRPRK